MRSRCCLCLCMCVCACLCIPPLLSLLRNVSVKVPLSLLGNGSVKIAVPLLGNGSIKIPLSFIGKRLGRNPPIVDKQRSDSKVTEVTNTYATVEWLLDTSFSMWPVSYQGN
jgi:hypothetical protein